MIVRLRKLLFTLPGRRLGKLILTNEAIGPFTAYHWESWGQEDIQPFGDDVTVIGDLP